MKNFWLSLIVSMVVLIGIFFVIFKVTKVPDMIPHEGGYTIILLSGEEKRLDYPACESYMQGLGFATPRKQMVRCYDSEWNVKYLAQITSFTINEPTP